MARIKKRLLAASALTAAAILGTTTAASAGHYEEGAGGKKLLNQVSQVVQVCGNDRTNTGFLVIDFGSNDCGAVASTNTHDKSFSWDEIIWGGNLSSNQVSQVVQVCGNDRTNTGFLVIDFGSNDCGAVASTNTHDESFRWGKDGAHGGFLNGWEWFLNKYGW